VGGIEVTVPEGWDGRVYYVSGYPRPVVRVASFELPALDGITAGTARSLMLEDDALISLTEYIHCPPCPGFDPTTLPLTLESADFEAPFDVAENLLPQDGDVPDAHDFARRTFETNSRFFDLWVEFGKVPVPGSTLSVVNEVLASLTVDTYSPPPQPDGVCNEWSPPKDPDCSTTVWLKSLLSAAGFEPVDDPDEQTLVGVGAGARFFIWVQEPHGTLEEKGFPVWGVVDGTPVYGGEQTLVWRAQGFDVWIAQGPFAGDLIPDRTGVEALVRATMHTAYAPAAASSSTSGSASVRR
jgi:hypothetical protein